MKHIDYFKMQAKNLMKDWIAKRISEESETLEAKYFDVERITLDFNISDKEITLMRAQHMIAKIAGFSKWAELVKVDNKRLGLVRSDFSSKHYLTEYNRIKSSLSYLKDLALELYEVWKNRELEDEEETDYGDVIKWYHYDSNDWDVLGIIVDFDFDEENFTIENAKAVVAYYAGDYEWERLEKASASELALAKALVDNRRMVFVEDWIMYIGSCEDLNHKVFDADMKLALFESYYLPELGSPRY